jgi:hypothetical protein
MVGGSPNNVRKRRLTAPLTQRTPGIAQQTLADFLLLSQAPILVMRLVTGHLVHITDGVNAIAGGLTTTEG